MMTLRETKGLARHFRECTAAGTKRIRHKRTAAPTGGNGPRLMMLPKCFICGYECYSTPDAKPPYRCMGCYAAVVMNEADGELA